MKVGLTERERAFVREYGGHGDGRRAAIAAGYSETRAAVTASELLLRPEIVEAIEERDADLEVARLSAGDVIDRLTEEERRIVEAYVECLSWSATAQALGLSYRGEIYRVRRRPHVLEAVEALLAERRVDRVATALELEERLTAIVRGEIDASQEQLRALDLLLKRHNPTASARGAAPDKQAPKSSKPALVAVGLSRGPKVA